MKFQAALCLAWCLLGLARSGVIRQEDEVTEDSFRGGEDISFPTFNSDDEGEPDLRERTINYFVKMTIDNPAEANTLLKDLSSIDFGDIKHREVADLLVEYAVGGLKWNAPPSIHKYIKILQKYTRNQKELDMLINSLAYIDFGPKLTAKAALKAAKVGMDLINAGLGITDPNTPAGRYLGIYLGNDDSPRNKFRRRIVTYLAKKCADSPVQTNKIIKELGTVDMGDMTNREVVNLMIRYGVGGIKPGAPEGVRRYLTIIEKYVPDRKELDMFLNSLPLIDLGPRITSKAVLLGAKLANELHGVGIGATSGSSIGGNSRFTAGGPRFSSIGGSSGYYEGGPRFSSNGGSYGYYEGGPRFSSNGGSSGYYEGGPRFSSNGGSSEFYEGGPHFRFNGGSSGYYEGGPRFSSIGGSSRSSEGGAGGRAEGKSK